ncbi:clustered mitochondria protein homolog isoform X3 [Astatotilapia calliptera]|uniref:clustered mitochondria protein homolog isoform X3 n=1 Tax=Astatotilapia calliptera TaxID=8154 RepID=UPI000E40BEF4|nr:clustered mitochondria protein homolog isoform X3 [Astatotilapia calliptera]
MGNIFQCCQTLSNYFKCQDTPGLGEAERSPLLSSEESECESLSLLDNSEDDVLTVSTNSITNLALEPENFLFPDIILSSSLGGDVTLVEPMVCLLVSEEDEGGGEGMGEQRSEEQGRSNEMRGRGYSEVETQTEIETQIGMGVQTQTESQTEVQTQTETLEFGNKRVVRGGSMIINSETGKEMHDWDQHEGVEQLLLEAQTSEKKSSDIWCDVEVSADLKLPGKVGRQTAKDKLEVTATLTKLTLQTERNTDPIEEEHTDSALRESTTLQCNKKPDEQKTESKHTSVMQADHKVSGTNENIAAVESEKMTKCSNNDTENVENFNPTEGCVNLKQQSNQDNGQMEELEQTANEKQHNNIHIKTNNSVVQTAGHIQSQDKSHLPKKLEETIKTDERQAEGEEEGETKIDRMTLFLVDRLFLGATHVQTHPNPATAPSEDDLPEQSDDDKRKKLSIQDIVDLQETSFTVRIQPPGTESFELQVTGQMLVVELHQVLMDHEITCHRTCFSLQLGGVTLDSLNELHSVPGIRDGAVIKVVEESYSVRDARLHLRHVRDLLRSLDPTDAYNGVNGSSLSYLTFYTTGNNDGQSVGKRRASERESVDCSPPEYVLPGSKERPLCPLQPVREDWKPLQCLRVLTLSSWNPPPGNRKMHGDLIYLNVLTMEDRELNITSSTRGFFLNQSTAFNFNPKPAVPKTLCHSLVELLSQVSPAFRKNFTALQKKRVQQHPYERIAAPFQVFTWTAPHEDHTLDCVRAEETHASYMGQDEHTVVDARSRRQPKCGNAGHSRDWNEELQGCRELPGSSLQERLHRERSIFKTNSDFVAAATRGATAVIDGNIMPINPGESPHLQMFMWNNLFFSQGFDVSEHYRPLGGNTAAHAAAICDLRGAQAYASVDIEGLHTIGTVVVDYRGVRVIAQTIIPGILEKNQEESIVYGSNDNGKTVFTHPRFLELLDKTSKQLRIQRHQVLDHNNRPVELCSGIETIGILGNDGRPYILDLLRTFPPDLNFQFSETEERREEVPKECQSFGYPCLHCHSLASLRPELIEAFIQHRYELFMKMVSHELSQLTEQDEATEWSEKPICDSDTGERPAASADMEISARFPAECLEEVQRQRCLLWEAAAFLLSHQIPAMLMDCLDHTAVPMDGGSLTSALHQRGVNVRYLGTILRELGRVEERRRLGHIQRICVSEIILRSAKHIFRTYLQDVEPAAFSAAVSHFLNCLLTSSSCFPDSFSDELLSRRRSRRRRSHGSRVTLLSDSVWARLTSGELWGRIRAEARDYYHYTFDSESIDEVIEKHNLQRISLLREIAIKTGIQVQLREYVFESRHRPAFGEEDIVNMFPVVRHLKPTSSDATQLVQQAQLAVQQGLLKECYDLISQALTLFSSVCGVLHEDVCMCLRLLGRLSYILGENADALSHQEKAVMSSERLHGIDHPQTIQDYTFLTLYCFAGGHHLTSLQLLYRARYLTLLVGGDDHPQVALLDSMLGLVLHGLMEYELSLKFLQNALTLTSKYHGVTSLKHANSHHLLATVYESKGEFRSALHHEKEAYSIYKSQVGENHNSTTESSEYLKSLTQQAVILQKAINQIYSNTPGACIPPPKFSTPNLPTILQQLNLTCGIILIPLSGKEIDELRAEFKGKVKVKTEELENQLLSSVE